jgi:hypothetical protein
MNNYKNILSKSNKSYEAACAINDGLRGQYYPDIAISRFYYSALQLACYTAFITGLSPDELSNDKSHDDIIKHINKHVDISISSLLWQLKNKRKKADYYPEEFLPTEANNVLQDAQRCRRALTEFIRSLQNEQ